MSGIADQRQSRPDEPARLTKAERECSRRRDRLDFAEPAHEAIFELTFEFARRERKQSLGFLVRFVPDDARPATGQR